MYITGKLIQLLPMQTGTGKNGEWKKQEIIIETSDKYPKKVCVSVWGDKIDAGKLTIGNYLSIDFTVESREYNGRWYTDVKANRIDISGEVKNRSEEMNIQGISDFPTTPPPDDDEKEILPF